MGCAVTMAESDTERETGLFRGRIYVTQGTGPANGPRRPETQDPTPRSYHGHEKAPPVENFAWLPVGYKANKTGRGSVSLI